MILQKLDSPLLHQKKIDLWVLRLDQIHPQISGNKWFKLKYNIEEAKKQKKKTILTFGGAFSNHIYATAKAGEMNQLKTIGVIRGEETLPLNSTLAFAKNCGMELYYMDRTTYREKKENWVLEDLQKRFGDFYLVPEGGSNELAVKGCAEILKNLPPNFHFDTVCTAVGTGGTLAGIIASLSEKQQAIGFPALKGASFLYNDVNKLLKQFDKQSLELWKNKYSLQLDYHFGGYAKKKPELLSFIDEFQRQHLIPIEPIYTGKLFFGIFDLIKKGFFEEKSVILALHTGGLRPGN